jgi:Uma2 family endonuclease
MVLNPQEEPMPIEQYFLLTENNNQRYEYYTGHLRALSAGTSDHATIAGNMYIALRHALEDDELCMSYVANKMVRVDVDSVVLPDVVVTCDVADHGQSLVIESPIVVVEVLPKTVQMFDRTRKLTLYQAKESIKEIVFVSQEVQFVEVFTRTHAGWFYRQSGADQRFSLECLDIEIEVKRIYTHLAIPVVVEEGGEISGEEKI